MGGAAACPGGWNHPGGWDHPGGRAHLGGWAHSGDWAWGWEGGAGQHFGTLYQNFLHFGMRGEGGWRRRPALGAGTTLGAGYTLGQGSPLGLGPPWGLGPLWDWVAPLAQISEHYNNGKKSFRTQHNHG